MGTISATCVRNFRWIYEYANSKTSVFSLYFLNKSLICFNWIHQKITFFFKNCTEQLDGDVIRPDRHEPRRWWSPPYCRPVTGKSLHHRTGMYECCDDPYVSSWNLQIYEQKRRVTKQSNPTILPLKKQAKQKHPHPRKNPKQIKKKLNYFVMAADGKYPVNRAPYRRTLLKSEIKRLYHLL